MKNKGALIRRRAHITQYTVIHFWVCFLSIGSTFFCSWFMFSLEEDSLCLSLIRREFWVDLAESVFHLSKLLFIFGLSPSHVYHSSVSFFSFVSTMVQNRKKHSKNSHPIIHFPSSSKVSERSRARKWSKQCSARARSERCEGMSKWTSKWTNTYVWILDYSRPYWSLETFSFLTVPFLAICYSFLHAFSRHVHLIINQYSFDSCCSAASCCFYFFSYSNSPFLTYHPFFSVFNTQFSHFSLFFHHRHHSYLHHKKK